MKKPFNTYREIPISDEGSVNRYITAGAVALVAGAVALTGANTVKHNVADTMSANMGKAIHEQITGEDASGEFKSALDSGKVDIPKQFYDVDSHKQDK